MLTHISSPLIQKGFRVEAKCGLSQKQSELTRIISNLNIQLEKCTDFVQNISKIWGSGTLVEKQKLQKLMFPEGIMIDPISRQYRT